MQAIFILQNFFIYDSVADGLYLEQFCWSLVNEIKVAAAVFQKADLGLYSHMILCRQMF